MLDDGYSLKVGDVMFRRNPSDGSRQPAFVTDEAPDNVPGGWTSTTRLPARRSTTG